jgi:DNA invertase Pin-like site-specific DNA recombinase
MMTKGANDMDTQKPYSYTLNDQQTASEINPGEANKVRRLFEQAVTKGVAMYSITNDPGKEANPKRAAIYARSATRSQEVTGMSNLDKQIRACLMYCAECGYTLDDQHVYQEIVGGKEYKDRPQFTTMRTAAKERQFDVLVIFSLDRLARDSQFQTIMLNELTQAGITVECVEGHELEVLKIAQAMKEEAARIERQQIIKRMQYGKAAKKAQREQQ